MPGSLSAACRSEASRLGGGTSSQQNEADWCDYVNEQPGFTCPADVDTAGETMLGLALHGVPLGGIPLGGIPLGGIPLGGIPLGGIAVGTPLGGIPLGGINLVGTPLGGIPLGGIDMSVSPLGGITLGVIPQEAKDRDPRLPDRELPVRRHRHARPGENGRRDQGEREAEDLGYYKDANGNNITLAQISSRACRPRRRSRICSPPSS